MVDVLCERVLRVGVAERGGNVAAYKLWVIVYYNYPDTAELLVLENFHASVCHAAFPPCISFGFVVMSLYISVSLGKRSTKGTMTLP